MSHILITGAGGTLGAEVYVIQKALEEFGYVVELKDQHPNVYESDAARDEFIEHQHKHVQSGKCANFNHIVLETKHLPWGG